MRGKCVMLSSTDPQLLGAFETMLAMAGNKTLRCQRRDQAISALDRGEVDLAIVDISHFRGALGLIDIALTSVPTIAITSGHDLSLLSALVCDMGVAHVMARPDEGEQAMTQILVTAEKLLRNDLFGLDKYIGGLRAQLLESTLANATERDQSLSEITDFLRELKAPRHVIPTIANAADEMLTNAIYNAPVDARGTPLYAATDRRSKIALSPTETVTLRYGVEDSVFGISVADQFGRLRHSHLSRSISRCVHDKDPIEQKSGGAGLGLFLIARTAHQFIINVLPDCRTEVIALWDLDRRRSPGSRAHHSLHYFEQLGQRQPLRKRPAGTRAPTSDWELEPSTNPGFN